MSLHECDILIIGSGVAGLISAIKLADTGLKIGIYSREEDPSETNSKYAQGGIVYPSNGDDLLSNDIQKASSYTSNQEAIDIICKYGEKIFKEIMLDKINIDFDKDENGEFIKTMEAAHSFERIFHKKDFTGKEIQNSLVNYISDKKRYPNVSIYTKHTAIDLLTPTHRGISLNQRYEDEQVVGSYVFDQRSGNVIKVMAKTTIIATGGFGALYLHHSNSMSARGDGIAMAERAGAFLSNMEFIQFHPTTFYNRSSYRRFLISEAIRGEGGVLINAKDERFMHKYHQDGELAPRDVVSRAILEESIKTNHDCVYLDISYKKNNWIENRFPTIFKHCLNNGKDIRSNPIPVVPAAHYTCGGIKTDLNGKTNLKSLYAVGEVACTGLHGANRLASTSLLECVIWGYRVANNIIEQNSELSLYPQDKIKNWEDRGQSIAEASLVQQDWLTLKQTMWNYLGVTRSIHRLNRAQALLSELRDEITGFYKDNKLSDELIGLRNAVEVGHKVLIASRRNNHSIGCFYRQD